MWGGGQRKTMADVLTGAKPTVSFDSLTNAAAHATLSSQLLSATESANENSEIEDGSEDKDEGEEDMLMEGEEGAAAGEIWVKPRYRRRSEGRGGKLALGGRPSHPMEDVSTAPFKLTPNDLQKHFHMSLNEAAKRLGICATAIKKVCRRMGIMKWPYQKLKPIQRRLAKLQAQHKVLDAAPPAVLQEMKTLDHQRQQLLKGKDVDITTLAT